MLCIVYGAPASVSKAAPKLFSNSFHGNTVSTSYLIGPMLAEKIEMRGQMTRKLFAKLGPRFTVRQEVRLCLYYPSVTVIIQSSP